MAYRVSDASLRAAVAHLCRYGDTDVFPHLPELSFFSEEEDAVVTELATLDLDSYAPTGAFEALAPKNRYGFRIVHQLPALDALLLLACVIEIGENIEAKRQPVGGRRVRSYRFSVDLAKGQVFRPDRTYKDWLHSQQAFLIEKKYIKKVVSTDISDFYARINYHRLENLLDEAASGHGAVRFIKKHIKVIRARQSFGLPVGGSAARILAELALTDTDQALRDRGLLASRFVDDFRIFLKASDDPYDALGFLAEQLGINEGLSLNVSKTSVSTRRDYLQRLERMTSDVDEEAEGVALEKLTADLYFDEEPDEEDLERLKGINLVDLLNEEFSADNWDMNRIRVIFRALRIAKPKEAIDFIRDNFCDYVIFAKDLCLLMEAIEDDEPGCFDQVLDDLVEAVLCPPASSVQIIRTWLIEILVRGVVNIPMSRLKDIDGLSATVDKRKLLLLRGRLDDKNYFRRHKTAIHTFSDFERICLIWGASCLPKDEYNNWIDSIKANFDKPLGPLFLKWAQKCRSTLIAKLKAEIIDHPD